MPAWRPIRQSVKLWCQSFEISRPAGLFLLRRAGSHAARLYGACGGPWRNHSGLATLERAGRLARRCAVRRLYRHRSRADGLYRPHRSETHLSDLCRAGRDREFRLWLCGGRAVERGFVPRDNRDWSCGHLHAGNESDDRPASCRQDAGTGRHVLFICFCARFGGVDPCRGCDGRPVRLALGLCDCRRRGDVCLCHRRTRAAGQRAECGGATDGSCAGFQARVPGPGGDGLCGRVAWCRLGSVCQPGLAGDVLSVSAVAPARRRDGLEPGRLGDHRCVNRCADCDVHRRDDGQV